MAGSKPRALGVLVAVGLGLAACGSSSTVSTGAPAAPSPDATAGASEATNAPAAGPTPTAPDRSASILPSVALTDVRSGATVDLASLVPAQRPLLLWFWAPH